MQALKFRTITNKHLLIPTLYFRKANHNNSNNNNNDNDKQTRERCVDAKLRREVWGRCGACRVRRLISLEGYV